MGKLTDRAIRDARPGRQVLWLGDGDGLWLRVRPHRNRPDGTKTFVLRRQREGKISVTTLGSWPRLSLKDARQRAQDHDLIAGDPCTTPVGDAVTKFLETVIVRRYRRPEQIQGYLKRDLAPIARRQLIQVRRADLSAIIQKKVEDGPVAANRLLEATRRFFRYCVEMGWLQDSPADRLSRDIAGGPEVSRSRILTDDEIRRVWTLPAPHGPLLRFLLYTGARIGEAQKATWSNISGELWTIPAEHSKNGRPHLVHLSSQARDELAALPRDRELVFGLTSDTAVQALMRRWCDREGIDPRFTPHDLRRTFSTRMNSIGIMPHVVEKCLNHTLQGMQAIYNRAEYLEERRAAFQALGREIARIVQMDKGRIYGKTTGFDRPGARGAA